MLDKDPHEPLPTVSTAIGDTAAAIGRMLRSCYEPDEYLTRHNAQHGWRVGEGVASLLPRYLPLAILAARVARHIHRWERGYPAVYPFWADGRGPVDDSVAALDRAGAPR